MSRYLGGHVSIGPLTLYGANAMHFAANLRIPSLGVHVCARPTTWHNGWWPWYVYVSPNATPWAALFGWGPGFDHWRAGGWRNPDSDSARARRRWGAFCAMAQSQGWDAYFAAGRPTDELVTAGAGGGS